MSGQLGKVKSVLTWQKLFAIIQIVCETFDCELKLILKNRSIINFWKAYVAAHLRVMLPTPSRQKDTLMLREELKFQN